MSLQQLLGKNYKWWYLVWYNFRQMHAYRWSSITWAFSSFFGLLGTVFVWYIAKLNGSQLNFNEIVTYLVIGNFFNLMINCWVDGDMAWEIKGGNITSKLMYPTNIIQRYFIDYIGKGFLAESILYGSAALAVIPFFWNYVYWASNIWVVIGTVILIPIGYCINFFSRIIIGSIIFWMTHAQGLFSIRDQLFNFLRGGLVPLYVISPFISGIEYNPLAWLGHHAMMTYLGKYDLNQYLVILTVGVVWVLILAFCGINLFKQGLRKNESVGL